LLAIVLQALILSSLYPLITLSVTGPLKGLMYVGIVGAFFWTSDVLAFVVKQKILNAVDFIAMETFYLVLQFGIYGVLFSTVFELF